MYSQAEAKNVPYDLLPTLEYYYSMTLTYKDTMLRCDPKTKVDWLFKKGHKDLFIQIIREDALL